MKPFAVPAVLAITVSAMIGAGSMDAATYAPTSPMVFVTANIGRTYTSPSQISGIMERLRGNVNDVSNGRPRYIGWQEIDEDDPADEMQILKDAYPFDWGWRRTLDRTDADGSVVPLKVPTVAHDAQKSDERIAFGSSGMEQVSPTRWITVTRYGGQNISLINTHFIAGAFDNCPNCPERLDRWQTHWENLKQQVAREHGDGFNVVLTGDFNRRKADGGWTPANVHPRAAHVKNGGLDHIVAVPRAGWRVDKVRNADGAYKQGEWWIGIDSHEAHWVTLQFQEN